MTLQNLHTLTEEQYTAVRNTLIKELENAPLAEVPLVS